MGGLACPEVEDITNKSDCPLIKKNRVAMKDEEKGNKKYCFINKEKEPAKVKARKRVMLLFFT